MHKKTSYPIMIFEKHIFRRLLFLKPMFYSLSYPEKALSLN